MNYSTDSRNKTEKKNKSNKKQVKKKSKVTAFRIIIMTIIIGMFAIVGGGLGVFIGIIKSAPDVTTIDLKPQGNYTSFVYDDSGKVQITTFAPTDNREYVKLSDVPQNLQDAIVATEDERFYEHNGIDIKGIFRAIVKNLQTGSFSEGASTITQQLVKNNVLTSDKKITRKIQEQYLAIEFEKIYDKETILEYYLNTIGLGQGVAGVQSASKRYFGKDVKDLTLMESAVIAGITQYPVKYNPITNPENNREKALVILQKMEDQGYITAEEHAEALKENPYENIKQVHEEFTSNSQRTYFEDALFNQLVADLVDLGFTEAQAKKEIYGGGLIINSTVNLEMQDIADKYINDDSMYPSNLYKVQVDYSIAGTKADGSKFQHSARKVLKSDDQIESFKAEKLAEWGITEDDTYIENTLKQPQPQAAFVLMDYTTGQIKALAGGRGDKTNLGFNFATQAERQPGSTFKILAAYAPALDTGLLSPGSEIVNEAVTYKQPNGTSWSPNNWDNNYDGKYYSVREAIANSMNVIAVKTLDQVGINTAFNYLEQFGFTTLVDSDKYLPLALGGITNGVTPLELNAAYGAIANDGTYVKPIFYTTVIKKETGEVIIDNTGENIANNSHQVIKTSTARMLTDMMQEVIDGPSKHTGSSVRTYFKNMPIAGKTGTTSESKDLLFAGYTPYYVATIWTGYDQPEPISSANGGNSYHMKIWSKIMGEIHQNLEYKSFPGVATDSTTGVKEVRICTKSGKLATDACALDEDHCVKGEFFTNGNAPKDYCDVHEIVEICTESGKIANEYCPEKTTQLRINGEDTEVNEVCDIHVSDEDKPIEDPLLPGENPDELIPPENIPSIPSIPGDVPVIPTPEPSPSPTPEPSPMPDPILPEPSPEPSLPPVVDSNTPPSIDDEDDFAIPQY
ncbi:MAG: PBP1A family penicillin-binding protein [Cellulosilyticum sp.]|nr:PBP1A family penicillin-binding protein [Cellulosilyticum sp.]